MILPFLIAFPASVRVGTADSAVTLTQGIAASHHQSGPAQLPHSEILSEIATGTWKSPGIAGSDRSEWKPIQADAKGHFGGPATENGWIDFTVHEDADKTVLINALGDSYFFVNGIPRVGDVYESNYAKLPIHLHAGDNDLLFRCARGDLAVQLLPVDKAVALDGSDSTLPDLRPHESGPRWGALLVRNATDEWQKRLKIKVTQSGRATFTAIHSILPMSLGKVGFQFLAQKGPKLHLELMNGNTVLDSLDVNLRERKENETYKETFLSAIDGSVQYFAVNPAWNQSQAGLALSLHGAGVEASGQADAYSSKPWCNIVCPTNRRPFGFDWEDWGRMDALEVLKIAEDELKPDPSRIYLVGHSMGGHGTILNGALYPGDFAAIAPSAGWISASTYAGMRTPSQPDPAEAILDRASYQDETRRYLANYKSEAIYLLQGGADDNVPPEQERSLAKLLSGFHHDYIYNEVPGQPHWWDLNPEPGADCIDLADLWDDLARHSLPPIESVHSIDFSTSNPEVSSTEFWATIAQQQVPLRISRVQLHADPFLRKIRGNTRNVRLLKLGLSPLHPGNGLEIDLDGQTIKLDVNGSKESVWLKNENGRWAAAQAPNSGEKSPQRNGPFRLAFQHNFVFVYGTHGTKEENSLLLQKVRYDAEQWWYRANGSVDIVPDSEFTSAFAKGRNIILYGNADTNSAWKSLLPASAISVRQGSLTSFGKETKRNDLASLFWWPKEGSAVNSIGVVGATGPNGIRSTFLVPYLQPMIGFPDYLDFSARTFAPNQTGSGILDDGFYGNQFQFLGPHEGEDLPPTPLDRVEDLPSPAHT